MLTKFTLIAALAAFCFVPFLESAAARTLSSAEAADVRGADELPAWSWKCVQVFKQHECNDLHNIDKCSGQNGGDNECKACRVAGETVNKKVWRCEKINEPNWDCEANTGDEAEEDCGQKYEGVCTLVNEEWFCSATTATTAECLKNIKKICN